MLVNRQGDPDFVKVLDFGLAKVAVQALANGTDEPLPALTRHGAVFGTPKYMAPEQCAGDTVDGRADLYALGLVLYEMLTGVHPFDGHNPLILIKHQLTTPVPAMKVRAPASSVPAAVEALVMRLTEKSPASRYASAAELLTELATLAGGEAASPPLPSSQPKAATPPAPVASPGNEAAGPAAPTVVDLNEQPGPNCGQPPPPLPPPPLRLPTLASLMGNRPMLVRIGALLLIPLGLLLYVLASRPSAPPVGRSVLPDGRRAPARAMAAAAAAAKLATQAQLDQAIAMGIPALSNLTTQYPADARVKRALAHTYMAQQDGIGALRFLGQTIALDATMVSEGELMQATQLAMKTPESAAAALPLLETECGARGVDVLYALSSAKSTGHSKLLTSIRQSLTKPAVRALATPAALIALDLRAATRCEAKQALLARAGEVGDQRALQQLTALSQTRGCGAAGRADCWACLRQDGALQSAIAAITARAAQPR